MKKITFKCQCYVGEDGIKDTMSSIKNCKITDVQKWPDGDATGYFTIETSINTPLGVAKLIDEIETAFCNMMIDKHGSAADALYLESMT